MESNILTERGERGISTVRVTADLIGSFAREFTRSLEVVLDSAPRELVVDLAGVDTINSHALSALLRAQGEMEERRGQLVVTNVRPGVKRVLEITETADIFLVRG